MTGLRGARILITTDAVGGVWVYSITLARALARRGCDLVVLSLGPRPREDQLLPLRDVPNIEFATSDFALEWMDPEGHDFDRAREGLAGIARRVKPDIVHLNSYREALGDWHAPVLVAAHSCVRSWSLACRGEEPSRAGWAAYVTHVEAALGAADRWVAPTAAFRDHLQFLYAPPRSGTVIHNGVDMEPGAFGKERFILVAGRLWDEAKNVQAVASVAGELPWSVRLAGSGNPTAFHPNLEFVGDLARSELISLMARASVFLAPVLYEPFGLCALEAASAGCALVLADIPTLREVWSGAALFVDPRDRRALAAALQRVCADAGLRVALQRAAALRARRYSVASMVDAYGAIYRELLRPPLIRGNFAALSAGAESLA